MRLQIGSPTAQLKTPLRASFRTSKRLAITSKDASHSNVDSAINSPRRACLLLASSLVLLPLSDVHSAQAAPEVTVQKVQNLSSFQRVGQRNKFKARAKEILIKYLDAADSTDAMRLILNEAATYDVFTKKGGFDGSVFLCREEADRPENKALSGYMNKLLQAKKSLERGPNMHVLGFFFEYLQEIDSHPDAAKTGPISYADLMALGAQSAVTQEWAAVRLFKTGKDEKKAKTVETAFGTPFTQRIGRQDSSECPPPSNVPSPDADPQTVRDFFWALGNKEPKKEVKLFDKKPQFAEGPAFLIWTAAAADPEAEGKKLGANPLFQGPYKSYTLSKQSATRTNYEVDFIEAFDRITSLGATYDTNAYLAPEESLKLKL